ncbi:MAG TPA: L,D-transpeptidase family protein [Bryobacteraceae bacterium]|nr:L,D-transpeptidase family protein [Bryobacteraceae bacterium]
MRYYLIRMRPLALAALAAFSVPAPRGEPDQTRAELRRLAGEGRLSDLRWPNFSSGRSGIARFYETDGFAPVWVRAGAPTSQALALIQALEAAAEKGLDPEDYDAGRWATRLERLRSGAANPSEVARFELALTVSATRFASDLRFGRVNRPGEDMAVWVRSQLVSASNPSIAIPAALSSIEPPFGGYRRAGQALALYRKLASENQSGRLPEIRKPVRPGDSYPGLQSLAALLRRLGDLAGTAEGVVTGETYSGAIVEAVRHFQQRHGLDADGVIGSATLRALNVPLSQRVQQIELALERWRQLPHGFARPPIVINIPEFELRAFDDSGRAAVRMKVVVGLARGHRTPVFSAEMTHLIFRPYWDVPESIVRRELLPNAAKDPEYFAKNHYEVVRTPSGGSRVRQAPGSDNALGGVKFVFPNKFDVYLHATPATVLFSKSRRDFSHGCIRVEKPEELAVWVLRDRPEWTRERIRAAMNGAEPVRVNLDAPIPVFIVYATALAGDNGAIRFFDDIYGYDASLERTLAAGRREWMDKIVLGSHLEKRRRQWNWNGSESKRT